MHYQVEMSHETAKATENICRMKGEGVVDYNPVTNWFKKFCLGCTNLEDERKYVRLKNVESEAVL